MPSSKDSAIVDQLIAGTQRLRTQLDRLKFGHPVTHVYNPLGYAWKPHEAYLRRFGGGRKRVVFLGMNPGPFGMVQTGVPFGEVGSVKNWMKIEEPVLKPAPEHPKRCIEGFACRRSEVSGLRLWGLFAARFPKAEDFFKDHFVINYCPLAFMEESGLNRTPDKLPSAETEALYKACDEYLRSAIAALQPEWIIGVGGFAEARAREVFENSSIQIGKILHPSPASPAANRDWAGVATRQLVDLGVWPG